MNSKKAEYDSGSYVNGIYTTKNGFNGSGLNCPRGTRLYDTSRIQPIFFEPESTEEGEEYKMLTQDVAPDVLPYYAISNYGHLINIKSGKMMKENYKPNGYGYFCLAAENCKRNQKKYMTHRLVMKTFDPKENSDELEVNHKNGKKNENYYQKVMEDGSIQSNLEWSTKSENTKHSRETGLNKGSILTIETVKAIREIRNEGYSYQRIQEEFYPQVSVSTIQQICTNKSYYDPNYIPASPEDMYMSENSNFKVTDKDANIIRNLSKSGFTYDQIRERFYPNVSKGTISDIVNLKTHNRNVT